MNINGNDLSFLEDTSLEELAPLAALLGRKMREYRQGHHGFVPRQLFLPWLALAGVYYCCDIIIPVAGKANWFWLKLRTSSEVNTAMVDKYQIVGPAGVDGQSAAGVLARALKALNYETPFSCQNRIPYKRHPGRVPLVKHDSWNLF